METAHTLRVILVDDDPDDHEFMEIACSGGQFNFDVRHFYDGVRFLEFIDDPEEDEQPDFVLLDLNMPRVTGWEVLEKLQSRREELPYPIYVLTTTRGDIDAEEMAIRLGARDFFTKPETVSQLKRLVESISARLVRESTRAW